MKVIKNTYIPTATQKVAHSAKQRYKLFGGAMGGGKSRWLCEEVKELSLQYPGNRGVMCRYHLSDFKNSTLKTLEETLQPELIRNHNRAEHTFHLHNGSEIMYMGLAEQENISKLKSMELGWFAIDEASEVPRENFLLFQSRLRRRLPNGTFPRYYGIMATNPEDCWLKDDFVLGRGGEDYLFIPSLPRDNPFLPESYERDLRKTYPEDWIRRFLEGNWDELSGSDLIIPADLVRPAVNREIVIEEKPVIAYDIARFGDDEIVGYFGKGNCLIAQDVSSKKSLMETVGRIINMRKKFSAKLIGVDDAGLGGGVTDRLAEMKEPVLPLNGGSSAHEDMKFANLKTEMLWYAREQFAAGNVSIHNDPILIRQLSSTKYVFKSNGKIMAEGKQNVKSRLGQSPDRADAFTLLLWTAKQLRDPARDFSRRSRRDFLEGPGVPNANDYGWSYTENHPNYIGV